MAQKRTWLAIVAVAVVAWGCASVAQDEEVMYEKASSLTKLSSALEAAVYLDEVPAGLQDVALLKAATRHDPTLLEPFQDFVLKADHQSGHGVVVVCDGPGEQALLQDLGCTAGLDAHLWKTPQPEACAVSTAAVQSCP